MNPTDDHPFRVTPRDHDDPDSIRAAKMAERVLAHEWPRYKIRFERELAPLFAKAVIYGEEPTQEEWDDAIHRVLFDVPQGGFSILRDARP